jgi:CheY-like chemotaxis protein
MMTVIEGYCSLLLTGNPDLMESAEGLSQIQQAARRASNLTRQLLMFSRQQVVRIEAMDLNQTVQSLLEMLTRLLGEDVTLQFQRRDPLPLIEADLGMMEQIVVNLSTNARDAMPKGGTLTISTDLVEVDAQSTHQNPEAHGGRFVSLAVSDTGCGMDETTRKHMFDPFFTTKDVGKGTGLGLATVYGIVKQHKGWIEVSSTLGTGSKITVFFPAATAPLSKPAMTPPGLALQRGHETVLLVEDEASLRDVARLCLKRQGYHVLEANNGVEALALWQEKAAQIDLLLTDMMMPGGISGSELADRLRAEKAELKVIISSGYNEEMARDGVSNSPGVTFLQKPYQLASLTEAVRKSLDMPRSSG